MLVPTAMSVGFIPPASVESLVSADLPQEKLARRINKEAELEIASALTAAQAATEKARSIVDILADVAECSKQSSVAAARGTDCADSTKRIRAKCVWVAQQVHLMDAKLKLKAAEVAEKVLFLSTIGGYTTAPTACESFYTCGSPWVSPPSILLTPSLSISAKISPPPFSAPALYSNGLDFGPPPKRRVRRSKRHKKSRKRRAKKKTQVKSYNPGWVATPMSNTRIWFLGQLEDNEHDPEHRHPAAPVSQTNVTQDENSPSGLTSPVAAMVLNKDKNVDVLVDSNDHSSFGLCLQFLIAMITVIALIAAHPTWLPHLWGSAVVCAYVAIKSALRLCCAAVFIPGPCSKVLFLLVLCLCSYAEIVETYEGASSDYMSTPSSYFVVISFNSIVTETTMHPLRLLLLGFLVLISFQRRQRQGSGKKKTQRGQAGDCRTPHFDIRLRWRPETEAAGYAVVSVRFITEVFLPAHETRVVSRNRRWALWR